MAGLYIHIPYCVRKCLYCDFVSYPEPNAAHSIVDYICREMFLREKTDVLKQHIDTVFIGGGTPSLLSGADIAALLSAARKAFDVDAGAEISMECNPGTLNFEKLQAYRVAGVNRLSIGLQSCNDTLLRTVGRIHTYAQFLSSYGDALNAGFKNINVDVMHGLPGQTEQLYIDTLQKVTSLSGITHISSYRLILEENTPLYKKVNSGEIRLPDEDITANMDDAGIAFLAQQGFERYEISNFAKDAFYCKHNMNYWENGTYIGVGPAAHGSLLVNGSSIRYENTEDVHSYRNMIEQEKLPESERRDVPYGESMFETVMLALRMTRGLSLDTFKKRFHMDFTSIYPKSIRHSVNNGWGTLEKGYFYLTPLGMDLQNRVLLPFMEERPY